MVWQTTLRSDQEIAIGDRVIIRKINGRIVVFDTGPDNREPIIKRASTANLSIVEKQHGE